MGAEQHYEILVLKRSGWALDTISGDRKAALEYAATLSGIEGFATVKVVQSVFDPGSGRFRESELRRFDNPAAGNPGRRFPLSGGDAAAGAAAVCVWPDDLHRPEARRTIAAVLGPTLDAWKLTPLELLHLPLHARRLHDSGTVLQGAVQKAAMALSRQGAGPAAGLVKKLYTVIAAATRRLQDESAGGALPPERRRFRALAERLAGTPSWAAKIERLFAELPPSPAEDELRAVDAVAAELLALPGGLGTLLRANAGAAPAAVPAAETGGSAPLRPLIAIVSDLLDLLDLQGTAPSVDIVAPGVRRFLALLRQGRLPEGCEAVLERVARELEGPRLLTGTADTLELEREARAIGDVASRVALLGVNGPAEAAIAVALENRSEALLRPESLEAHLGGEPATLVPRLLTLSLHLVGELNQSRIAKHLLAALASPAAVAGLAGAGGSGVLGQLRRLAAWQEEVCLAAFPADLRERLVAAIDETCQAIIAKAGLYSLLARRKPDPLDQALAIADLARTRALTRGAALEGARNRALACIDSAGGFRVFADQLFERSLSYERIATISRFLGAG